MQQLKLIPLCFLLLACAKPAREIREEVRMSPPWEDTALFQLYQDSFAYSDFRFFSRDLRFGKVWSFYGETSDEMQLYPLKELDFNRFKKDTAMLFRYFVFPSFGSNRYAILLKKDTTNQWYIHYKRCDNEGSFNLGVLAIDTFFKLEEQEQSQLNLLLTACYSAAEDLERYDGEILHSIEERVEFKHNGKSWNWRLNDHSERPWQQKKLLDELVYLLNKRGIDPYKQIRVFDKIK